MFRNRCDRKTVGVAGVLAGLVLLLAGVPAARAGQTISQGEEQVLGQLRAAGAKIGVRRHSGRLNFIGSRSQTPLQVPGLIPGASPEVNAMVLAEKYGPLFGLADPSSELTVKRQRRNGAGGGMVRYQQRYQGVPVLGGELVVNMDRGGSLLSMNGEVGSVPKNFVVKPRIERSRATARALATVAKWYRLSPADLKASAPELTVYDASLLGPGQGEPVRLVWKIEVTPRSLRPIRELVLVDAESGAIDQHFNQVDTALDRITYTANNTTDLQNQMVCDETSGDSCSNGSYPEVDDAHLYAGATYRFYFDYNNRDSFDNAGGKIISTANFYDSNVCPNAYWDGTQMVYCQGFPEADDVVGHELTHAVTDHTSNLFYYYQAGAINESLSDIFGEFIDQTDGYGTDTAAVKWLIGEDLDSTVINPPMVGALRDMRDPTLASDQGNPYLSVYASPQPDRMTSKYYDTGIDDQGGVHANNGVGNKAAYLITDGDTFNGQTVSGIGISKAERIYYEVQTNLLTSGSDYQDLANDLTQACTNLLGTCDGNNANCISQTDCDQVQKAVTAVEMDQQPVANFNPDADVCPSGEAVSDVFYDDFENGLSKWSLTSGTAQQQTWEKFSSVFADFHYSYATSGVESLFGPDIDVISDQRATMTVAVPVGQPYLHFRHTFDFENNPPSYYDGGVLEYSTDNGTTWHDAMGLYDSGQRYTGTIYSGLNGDNPLKGKTAFVGVSHGFVSTRLNLAALAGQTVKFRWRVGTDTGNGNLGWVLDDVRVYTCGSILPVAVAGAPQNVYRGAQVSLDGSASYENNGSIISYAWAQTGGPTVSLNYADIATPSFTAPSAPATLTFQLTVTDNDGATDTATTTVNVIDRAPIAVAGSDLKARTGTMVTLDGSGSSDPDGDAITYAWVQTGGPTVSLTNADTAAPSFTAPSAAATLTFRLTVTDSYNATASDTVLVTVSAPATATAESGGGGGCSLSRNGSVDPLLVAAFLVSLVMVCRRRRKE